MIRLLATFMLALVTGGLSDKPVRDSNWPAGSVEVANLKSRVGWMEGPPFGGGQWQFMYRGDTAAFQQAIDQFAKIKAPKLELVIHNGPFQHAILDDKKNVDWMFTVWNPASWYRLYNNPTSHWDANNPNYRQPLDAPKIDVYIGGGPIEWDKVKVPQGIEVIDERDGMIRGQVFDMLTSKPIAGADVNGGGLKDGTKTNVKTDADGRFELKDAPGEWFPVSVSADGYATRGVHGKRTTVYLSPAQSLSGRVVDTDNKPLAGVNIRANSVIGLDGFGYSTANPPAYVTDAEGRFTMPNLPLGYVSIHADEPTHFPLDTMKLWPVAKKEISIRMTLTGTIRGRVVNKLGDPVFEGTIDANPPGDPIGKWGGSMHLKPDGSFEFTNVPPGPYLVGNKMIEVQAGKTTEVEVQR